MVPLAIITTALILRLVLVLTHPGYLGVDGGAYILHANIVQGNASVGFDYDRPPLAPGWILVPFLWAGGLDIGYKVWAALASTLPVLGVWILGRRFLPYWAAVGATVFMAIDITHAEMLVTGALPMIAFTLLALAVYAISRLWERSTFRLALLLILALPAIAYTNQTTAGLTAIVLPVYVVSLVALSRNWSRIRSVLVPAALGVALAATALPWYWETAPGAAALSFPGPIFHLAGPFDAGWLHLVLALPVGLYLLWASPTSPMRALGAVIMVLGLLSPIRSYDESILNVTYRAQYLLPMFWYIGMAYIVHALWWPELRSRLPWTAGHRLLDLVWVRHITLAGFAAFLMCSLYVYSFWNQSKYSDSATPATATAIKLLDANATGVITSAHQVTWWILALADLPAYAPWNSPPPRAFAPADPHVRCVLGWVPGCDVAVSVHTLNVSHVLLDRRFPNYNSRAPDMYLAPPDPWEVTDSVPWLKRVYIDGATILYVVLRS